MSREFAALMRPRLPERGPGPPDLPPGASRAKIGRPGPWRRMVLRRDGRRPLVMEGAPLVAVSGIAGDPREAAGTVAWHVSVHLLSDGQAVAALSLVPEEDRPARPVFRAERIENGEDLGRFLEELSPISCFALMPGSAAAHAALSMQLPHPCGLRCAAGSPDRRTAA